ncbi:tRNA (5-methylaminomethyl-2-thiouridine)(34)-methyltransferase MnmD [Yoonia sp. R2331]|uniref:tRNA (5-methylaminomethyl-2-thiouridine)(34)-methyltransferase MnmD n=1 Tax=Yoonia sp. R2331 TaxID=3237238 RepID=UPI0034E5B5D1
MTDQTATLDWRDTDHGAVPVSTQFDDPYYSLSGGLEETRHVFLAGNDLPARFRGDFHIAELGFGTGLNLLTTWAAWDAAGATGQLTFTSFEAFPMATADMARALAAFPEVAPLTETLLSKWSPDAGPTQLTDSLTLNVITGDARRSLPAWDGRADAWFLDGFSPAKNPALWEPELLAQVHAHSAPGGSAATYSAAGHVRQALTDAGFVVARIPGFGRKRHMTTARRG